MKNVIGQNITKKLTFPKMGEKQQPFNLHRGIKQITSVPFSPGITIADPIVLEPKEESRLMNRYVKSEGDDYPVGTIVGLGDAKEPTEKQIGKFKKNRIKIVEPTVFNNIKKQGGIFHGKHNVNGEYKRLLGKESEKFIEETYDYDVWVGKPRTRANRMQKKLDEKMKCDIAYAVKQPAPHDAKARWVVRSKEADEGKHEVDYVSYPDPIQHPYKTRRRDGVMCETLESAMARDEVLKQVPLRSFKARRNLFNYQRYKASLEMEE